MPRTTIRSVGRPRSELPAKLISPLAGTSPTIALRVVDLPAPLAPSKATTSPVSMAMSMPRTARMAP